MYEVLHIHSFLNVSIWWKFGQEATITFFSVGLDKECLFDFDSTAKVPIIKIKAKLSSHRKSWRQFGQGESKSIMCRMSSPSSF